MRIICRCQNVNTGVLERDSGAVAYESFLCAKNVSFSLCVRERERVRVMVGGGDIGAAAGCSAGARIKHRMVCVRVQFVISPARAFAKGKMRRKKAPPTPIVRAASRLENIFFFLLGSLELMQTPPFAFVYARSAVLIPRRLCAEFIIIMLLREMSPYVGSAFLFGEPAASWR